jgi:hypothetical protein
MRPRLALTAFAAIALLALAAPGLAHGAGRLDLGIQDPLDPLFRERDEANAYSVVRALNIRFVRVPVAWSSVAPTRPESAPDPDDPAYQWGWLDERLAEVTSGGMEPLVMLYNPPRWARSRNRRGRRTRTPRVRDFAAFATAAARRYDGTAAGRPRVRYWQLLNEVNLRIYFRLKRAPQRYRALVNAGYRSIHAAARGNVVIAGGLAPFGDGGKTAISPLRFMRRMLCMTGRRRPRPSCRARSSFDVWSHHPYTSGGPPHSAFGPDNVSVVDLPRMRRLLVAARRAGHLRSRGRTRFWATEFSWDTKPPDPWGVPVRLHARWVAEALYRMWRSGVSLVVWFQLRDNRKGPAWGSSFQGGLYFRTTKLYADERAKPAARVLRFPFAAVRSPSRVTIWGRTPDSRRHGVVIERRVRGRWTRLAKARANSNGIFRIYRRGLRRALLRARVGRSRSVPFRAMYTGDRRVNPFGGRLRYR